MKQKRCAARVAPKEADDVFHQGMRAYDIVGHTAAQEISRGFGAANSWGQVGGKMAQSAIGLPWHALNAGLSIAGGRGRDQACESDGYDTDRAILGSAGAVAGAIAGGICGPAALGCSAVFATAGRALGESLIPDDFVETDIDLLPDLGNGGA